MTYSTDEPSWVALKLKPGFVLPMKRYIRPAPIAESRCYKPFFLRVAIAVNISNPFMCDISTAFWYSITASE